MLCFVLMLACVGRALANYRVAIILLSTSADRERVNVAFGAPPQVVGPRVDRSSGARRYAWPEATPRHARLGDRRSFWVQNDGGEARRWTLVQATLKYGTEHADIWIDDAVAGKIQENVAQALPRDAENAWQSQHGRFGSLSYRGGDVSAHGLAPTCTLAHVRSGVSAPFVPSNGELLSVLIVSRKVVRTGYAAVESYRPEGRQNCFRDEWHSNEMPGLIVLPLEHRRGREVADGVFVYATAHELQHLKYFVRHTVRSAHPVGSLALMNEGLSMLAEDFAVNALFNEPYELFSAGYQARRYLARPNEVSLLAFASLGKGRTLESFSGECYGGAYLFQRFIYDRYGERYLNAMDDTQIEGLDELSHILGVSAPDVFREFGRYLIQSRYSEPGAFFSLYQRGEVDEVGRAFSMHGPAFEPLPGASFDVLGGSVSLYASSSPVADITSRSPIVWTEVSDDVRK